MFATIDQVKELLAAGKTLVLAAEEDVLRAVPRGSWIGGTIPYFMTEEGGKTSRTGIFVEVARPSRTRGPPPSTT